MEKEIVEMDDICAVCGEKIGMFTLEKIQGITMHVACKGEFHQNPEKYGGKAIEKTDDQTHQVK